MYILTGKKQLEKAILRAKKIKPLVKMIEFGKYAVRGSKGDIYTVKFSKNSHGEKIIECSCPGGQKNLVCFHSAACLELHGMIVKRRQVEIGR